MLLAMTSETEKAHALLQSFSTASIVSSIGLGMFCFVADRLLQFSFIQQSYWLRALSDNMVHGAIGLWSWAIVIGLKKKSDFTEVLLAGFFSSVIDMDHFILAGSLSLKAALTLPKRPVLHCSTMIPVLCLMLKFVMHLLKLKDSWCFLPWMLFMSWTSHHIRDGIRHGLWICPFGKTVPLPYWLYVVIFKFSILLTTPSTISYYYCKHPGTLTAGGLVEEEVCKNHNAPLNQNHLLWERQDLDLSQWLSTKPF